MARTSYLRAIAGQTAPASALRPPRIPLWGRPRISGLDFPSTSLDPQATTSDSDRPVSDLRAEPNPSDRSIRSSGVSIETSAPRSPESRSAKMPSLDAPPVAQVSDVQRTIPRAEASSHPSSSNEVRKPDASPAVHTSTVNPMTPRLESVASRQETASPAGPDSPRQKILRGEHSQAFAPQVSVNIPLQHAPHAVLSPEASLQPKIRARNAALNTTAEEEARARPESLSPRLEMHSRREAEEAPDRRASALRQTASLFPSPERASGPTKNPDDRPSGNSIHIGSVDIHITPPPAPAPRQAPRQRTAAVTAMSRGFMSSFGLSQG